MNEIYQQRIDRVIRHITQHPQRQFALAELAELSHFSKFHFHRIFKSLTGETVNQLVSRLRLEKAAGALIYNKNQTITDIALGFGFSSSANFSKAFKQHFDYSPSQFRRTKNRSHQLSKIGKAKTIHNNDNVADLIDGIEVVIEDLPQQHLAYLRATGPYDANNIQTMFEHLDQWTRQANVREPNLPAILINWSDTFIANEAVWSYDACLPVTELSTTATNVSANINFQIMARGLTAQLQIWIAPKDFSLLLQNYWDYFLGHWLTNSDYQPAHKPSYECFGQFNDQGQQSVTLCLPIAPL